MSPLTVFPWMDGRLHSFKVTSPETVSTIQGAVEAISVGVPADGMYPHGPFKVMDCDFPADRIYTDLSLESFSQH